MDEDHNANGRAITLKVRRGWTVASHRCIRAGALATVREHSSWLPTPGLPTDMSGCRTRRMATKGTSRILNGRQTLFVPYRRNPFPCRSGPGELWKWIMEIEPFHDKARLSHNRCTALQRYGTTVFSETDVDVHGQDPRCASWTRFKVS